MDDAELFPGRLLGEFFGVGSLKNLVCGGSSAAMSRQALLFNLSIAIKRSSGLDRSVDLVVRQSCELVSVTCVPSVGVCSNS